MCIRCNCWTPLSVGKATKAIIDELNEFRKHPTRDEWDDVKVCANRLIGSFFKQASIQILQTPLYDSKVATRMSDYGCIRSKRHLIDGNCPSRTDQ